MNEKTIGQIEEEVLSYEVSDEAVGAAGTRTEIAGAWTFICTGVRCNDSPGEARLNEGRRLGKRTLTPHGVLDSGYSARVESAPP